MQPWYNTEEKLSTPEALVITLQHKWGVDILLGKASVKLLISEIYKLWIGVTT